jgi:hypothetical protein
MWIFLSAVDSNALKNCQNKNMTKVISGVVRWIHQRSERQCRLALSRDSWKRASAPISGLPFKGNDSTQTRESTASAAWKNIRFAERIAAV